jgi:hypothetical protein
MALKLKLSILENNDCKALRILDVTGNYSDDNKTGWGINTVLLSNIADYYASGPANPALPYALFLDFKIETTKYNGESAIIANVDVHKVAGKFGPFNDKPTDPESKSYWQIKPFSINVNTLVEYGAEKLKGEIVLPDGVYTINYILKRYESNAWHQVDGCSKSIVFVSGLVRKGVYKLLAKLPITTSTSQYYDSYDDALYAYTLLRALENTQYVSRKEDLINGLKTLEKLLANTNCINNNHGKYFNSNTRSRRVCKCC